MIGDEGEAEGEDVGEAEGWEEDGDVGENGGERAFAELFDCDCEDCNDDERGDEGYPLR